MTLQTLSGNFHDSLSEPMKYKSVTIKFFLYFKMLTCLLDLCSHWNPKKGEFSVLIVLDQKKKTRLQFYVFNQKNQK